MDIENYLNRLSAYHPLSSGLKAYIATIAKEQNYTKGDILYEAGKSAAFFPLITDGAVKITALNEDLEEEINLGFYFQHDFMYHYSEITLNPENKLRAKCIENTSIVTISEAHYSNTLKLFPEAYKLNLLFTSVHVGSLLNQLYIRNHFKARERYFTVLKEQPEIGKRISINDLTTFLGLDQTTISRIRAKK